MDVSKTSHVNVKAQTSNIACAADVESRKCHCAFEFATRCLLEKLTVSKMFSSKGAVGSI